MNSQIGNLNGELSPCQEGDDRVLLSLLASTDADLVLQALQALVSKTRSHHLVHDEETSKMIRELSHGWLPLHLIACVCGEESSPGGMQFEFYNQVSCKLQIIRVGMETLRAEDCMSLFNRLVEQFDVPVDNRFGLLTRIRFAKGLESTPTRHAYVKVMILALQLRWEKKLMPAQLRKLVRSGKSVPESIRVLALETLNLYGKAAVFSPADRARRVESFLSGNHKGQRHTLGFIQAMLQNSSPVTLQEHKYTNPRQIPAFIRTFASASNVLTWLERELEEPEQTSNDLIQSLLLSKVFQSTKSMFEDERARLDRCLVKLFSNCKLFGALVFGHAAAVLPAASAVDSGLSFMEAMVSVVIPSGWEVREETGINYFISHMTTEFETRTIQIILQDVGIVSDSLLLNLLFKSATASLLLEAGGYRLLSQIPVRVLLPGLKFDNVNEDLSDTVSEEIAGGLDLSDTVSGEIARGFCSDMENELHPDTLHRLNWMLLRTRGGTGFVKQLQANGGVDRLVAKFEAHAPLLIEIFFCIFKQLHIDGQLLHRVFETTLEDGSRVEKVCVPAVKKLVMVHSFLEQTGCRDSESLILGIWRSVDVDERAEVLSRVLHLMATEPSPRDDNIFAPRHVPESHANHLRVALSCYGSSLFRPNTCCGDLVKLGQLLTRDYELAQELLKTFDVTHLADKLLEAAVDPSSRAYAAQTLSHLLEDEETLYNSMLYKIQGFMLKTHKGRPCEVKKFLAGLSLLAFRDPAMFLRASFAVCKSQTWEEHDVVVLRKRANVERYLKVGRLSSGCLARLTDHLLARLNNDTVELLTRIVEELPVCGKSFVSAGAVERILESSFISEELVYKFFDVVDMHVGYKAVIEAFVTSLSSPELDNLKVINIFKRLPPCWEYVDHLIIDCAVKALSVLDFDHPEAEAAAGSVVETLVTVLDGHLGSYFPFQSFQGPPISDASLKDFCFQQQQTQSKSPEEEELDDEKEEREELDFAFFQFNDEQLESLVRIFWLPPRTGHTYSSLAYLLHDYAADRHASLSRLLLRMLLVKGSPPFVMKRIACFHLRLVRGHVFRFEDDIALAYIPLLIGALSDLCKTPTKLMEVIIRQLQGHEKTYSIPLTEEQVHSLCSFAIFTSDRISSILLSLVSLDPALSPQFAASIMTLSTQVITSALERLERKDYSYCGAVARLLRISDKVLEQKDTEAREHLAAALHPLWRFIHGRKTDSSLVEAFFIAQTLNCSDTAGTPTPLAMEVLQGIAFKHSTRLVKLALPMLRRWPFLASLNLSTKLEFLRGSFQTSPRESRLRLQINREKILQDSYDRFSKLTPELLRKTNSISVEFEGERGQDGGGLLREWYQVLSHAIEKELFSASGNPSPTSSYDHSYYKFAGKLVAKAIVDDKKLDIRFSPSLYKNLLGVDVTYKDIGDAEYVRNLSWLLENHVDESMGLTFSVDVDHSTYSGTVERNVHDLVAGGSDIPVTDSNKHDYVKLLAEYLLQKSFNLELDAFLSGFYEVIPKELISVFLSSELELVICGLPDVNVAALKSVAKCSHEHQILRWFWDTVAMFDNKQKSLLLRFTTGSSKVPFGGIKQFSVGRMSGGNEYLPTSHTCINEILLPSYETKEQLEHKLLLALHDGCEKFYLA